MEKEESFWRQNQIKSKNNLIIINYSLMKYICAFIFLLIAILGTVLIFYTTTQNISGNYFELKLSQKLIYIIVLNGLCLISYFLFIYPLKISISKNNREIILEKRDILFLRNIVKIKTNSNPYILAERTKWTGIKYNLFWEGEFKAKIVFKDNKKINSVPILLDSAYLFGALIGRALLTKEEIENIKKSLNLKVQFK